MTDIEIAVSLHVLAIVWWIGGVTMVTTVVLPACRRAEDAGRGFAMFQAIEGRFAWHARAATLLAGGSGFYLLVRLGLWSAVPALWWLDAMLFVWGLFTIILFVAEPLFLQSWLERQAREAPARTLAWLERLHWLLLSLSIVTIAGAVAGSH